jgi:hypothetical protein
LKQVLLAHKVFRVLWEIPDLPDPPETPDPLDPPDLRAIKEYRELLVLLATQDQRVLPAQILPFKALQDLPAQLVLPENKVFKELQGQLEQQEIQVQLDQLVKLAQPDLRAIRVYKVKLALLAQLEKLVQLAQLVLPEMLAQRVLLAILVRQVQLDLQVSKALQAIRALPVLLEIPVPQDPRERQVRLERLVTQVLQDHKAILDQLDQPEQTAP